MSARHCCLTTSGIWSLGYPTVQAGSAYGVSPNAGGFSAKVAAVRRVLGVGMVVTEDAAAADEDVLDEGTCLFVLAECA